MFLNKLKQKTARKKHGLGKKEEKERGGIANDI